MWVITTVFGIEKAYNKLDNITYILMNYKLTL